LRRSLPPMATVTMTIANHDQTVSDGTAFIDFWAEWCGPCKRFAPIFEQASERYPEITFAKVDTEDQRELAARYGVTSIPTLVIYRDGIPVFSQPGALPAAVLDDLVSQVRALNMAEVRAT
ncbi:MAG TPA: thioredoxin, partial [Jiangellaceae bacterium]|nr:thioredoxin [Jiangellaceae bacterium]